MFGAINSVLGIGVNVFLRDNFSPQANRIAASMDRLSQKTKNRIQGQLSYIQSLGTGMAAAGIGTFAALNAAKKEVDEFTLSLYKTKAIAGNMSQGEFLRLKRMAIDLSREFPTTATAISEGFLEFQKAGVAAKDMEKMTRAVLQFAIAADIPVGGEEGAAMTLIRTMGQYGKGYDQAAAVGDKIAAVANASVVSVSQIFEALKYGAPVMRQFNMSLEESLAWIGTGAQAGLTGSMFGTNFANMLTYLADASSQFARPNQKKALALMGLAPEDFVDAHGNLRNTIDILTELQSRLRGMGTSERSFITRTLFSRRGDRAATNLMNFLNPEALSGKPAKSIQEMISIASKAGAGDNIRRMTETMKEAPANQTILFKNAIFDLKEALVDVYNSALVPIMRVMTPLLHGIATFARTPLGKIVIGITMVGIALGTMAGVLMAIMSTIALTRLSYVAFFGKGLKGLLNVFQMLFLNMTGIGTFFSKSGTLWSAGKFIKGWGSALMGTGFMRAVSALGPWGRGIAMVAAALTAGSLIFPKFGAGLEYLWNRILALFPGHTVADAKAIYDKRMAEISGMNQVVPDENRTYAPRDKTQALLDKLSEMGKQNNNQGDIIVNVVTPEGKLLTTQKINRQQQQQLVQTLGIR